MVDEPQARYFDVIQGTSDPLSPMVLLSSIRRHLGVVVVLSLSLSAAGAVIGLGLPPWFQAEAVLFS
jgi:hypothetical protein